jgi:hypothetical protein
MDVPVTDLGSNCLLLERLTRIAEVHAIKQFPAMGLFVAMSTQNMDAR